MQQKQNEIKVVNDEIMLAHDELKQQTIELQQSNNAKSDFLATMSHEIRTPINGVVGMLTLLKQTDLDREQQQKVKLAHFSADSLLSIINDILDFSKIDANKLEVEAIDYDLCELLGNFTHATAHKTQEKNIELNLDLTQIETSYVKGDPGRLTQILTNLVGNAIKFTEQGEIKIQANLGRIDEQYLQLSCSISDTGIGVPKDRIATMFDRFIQVDASTTRKFGGTGLGLAIVKKLCQLMGGDISVTSELDKGSTFNFDIRLQHSDQQEKSAPAANLSNLNLLVVDDNKTNLTVLSEQLVRWGAKVLQTTDSQSTLNLMLQQFDENERKHFDMVLIDAEVPAIDGIELGQKIRSLQQFSATKLILMKPLNSSNDEKYYDDLGFDCCLTKPITKSDLADVLNAVISNDAVSKLMPSANQKPSAQQLKQQTLVDGMRVLLVDDNAINQAVASCQLRNLGAAVIIAKNGLEALQCLQEQEFDVVLMDCQMPVMDGYTATQKIRELSEDYRDIYIIAMTANAMKGDREKCLNAGMNDYLTKPIDFTLMETKLITASNRLLNADIISTGSI
ncbi:MAG: response regulator [Colwellia sp.]|nr:response regulator [Colwellia sp.]